MDPYTILTMFNGDSAYVSSPFANAQALGTAGGMGFGSMMDRDGSQPFSFMSNPLFGTNISSMGNNYSLMPDLISKVLLGRSWSLSANGQPLGSIGLSNPTNGIFRSIVCGGNLGPRMQSGLLSVLAATGQGG